MLQTKSGFFFFKSFSSLTALISTDSDSALALVNRKSKNMTREESRSPPLKIQ